jgi:hypothetical protein
VLAFEDCGGREDVLLFFRFDIVESGVPARLYRLSCSVELAWRLNSVGSVYLMNGD